MTPSRIGDLIEKYFEASLAADEMKALEQWLIEDPAHIDEFLKQLDVHVGLHQALVEMPEHSSVEDAWGAAGEDAWGSSGEDTWGSAEKRQPAEPGRRRLAWPLAAAAAGLLAFGLFAWFRPESPAVGSLVVAEVVRCSGPEASRIVDSQSRMPVRVADRLVAGELLATGPGTLACIRLADGTEIDLDGDTRIRLNAARDSAVLSLGAGRLYCRVTPRGPGAAPFTIGLKNGARAVAIGTRFELESLPGAPVRLVVEEGRVRLESTAAAAAEAGPLQALALAESGAIAGVENVPLHSIANWKFRPDSVPVGAVLFREDFEAPDAFAQRLGPDRPASTNGILWRVADGKGKNGSRGLVLSLRPNERVVLVRATDLRHKHLEMSFDVYGSQACLFYTGPVFQIPGVPGDGEFACKMGGGDSDDVTPMRWIHVQAQIRGNTVSEKWTEGDKVVHEAWGHVDDMGRSYTRLGFCASSAETVRPIELCMDNLVIRKIAPEPYPEVLFHDAFNPGALDRWNVFLGDWSIATGQGAKRSDGDCLQLDWKPGERAAIFAKHDLQNRDFELRFYVKSPTTVGYAPVLSASATDLNEALDIEPDSGGFTPGGMIPHNQWCLHRFTVRGRTIRHIATHNGKIFYDRTGRITDPRPFVQAGLLFERTKERCKVYVDSVSILRMEQ